MPAGERGVVSPGVREAGEAVDAGYGDGCFAVKEGEEGGEPGEGEGFAASRRTVGQQVMAAGRGDLECPHELILTAYFRELGVRFPPAHHIGRSASGTVTPSAG